MELNPKADWSGRFTGFIPLHLNVDWSRGEFRSNMQFFFIVQRLNFRDFWSENE